MESYLGESKYHLQKEEEEFVKLRLSYEFLFKFSFKGLTGLSLVCIFIANPIERGIVGRQKIESITPAQEELLLCLCHYVKQEKCIPSVRELGRKRNLTEATIHDQLQQLIKKGYLRRERGSRELEILKWIKESEPVQIPILGEIPAGHPLLEEENISGYITVEARLVRDGEYFALRVRGKSMIDAGIKNGDIALIRHQPLARNGNIIAAMLNGEVTLKRLKYQGNEVALVPENAAFKPIPITARDDFRILGLMIAVNPGAGGKYQNTKDL